MLEPGPGVEFGRYVVVGRPANYGAGSLVPARETRSGARRTLWLVMPQAVADPVHRAAVCRVATVLRKLESPHLLRLHEFGEVEGQPFFATAPLDGVDLAQVCAPDGIPPEEALDLIAQVGAGINHLHHAGLVEGALGPHRVLVEERDGRIHATVVHAAILPALLSTSALFGSQKQEALDFGAPELHRGEESTTRSDVYSLGCLLWLALTGERPVASHAGHRSAPTPQVQSDGPVAEALNSVLQRALAKDPAHRYRDVAAFAATIRAIAALAREGDVGDLPERL
ncbi:protein kinase domain-containing protein, partial [Nocardioides sp.]|uniref:protein kinase domain-containing protein n=1 Tax=Nocardioides sp. TaxID=35761 RepID=UPI002BA9137D